MNLESLYSLYKKHPKVCIDTRKVSSSCLFFALKGPNFNANEFASKALTLGASYAIVDEEKYVLSDKYILVDDVLQTLQKLANYHRKQLNTTIIGITGSNGKTTSKELCFQVLKQKYTIKATEGNLNNHIGVPLSLLSIPLETEIAIIEMGANHIGEIDFLCSLAEPDYGVITNVGKAHLEGFGDLEGVLQTKTELYRHLAQKKGTIFIKDNHQILKDMLPNSCPVKFYGQLQETDYKVQSLGAQPFVAVHYNNEKIQSQLIGEYNYDNIALSIALGAYFEVPESKIKSAIESYIPTNNRSQLIEGTNNKILLDAYNANPMSIEHALINMQQLEHHNKVIILGDMFEMGSESDSEHIRMINKCLSIGFKNVYLVGEDFHVNNHTSYLSFPNTETLIDELKKHPIKDAFILIKGSRGMKLEQLVNLF